MLAFYRGALQSSLWAKILERIENINGDSAESDYLHYVLLGIQTIAHNMLLRQMSRVLDQNRQGM